MTLPVNSHLLFPPPDKQVYVANFLFMQRFFFKVMQRRKADQL